MTSLTTQAAHAADALSVYLYEKYGVPRNEDLTDFFHDALSASEQKPVACEHEPFEGVCVHCGVAIVSGYPVYGCTPRVAQSSAGDAEGAAQSILRQLHEYGYDPDDEERPQLVGELESIIRQHSRAPEGQKK